MPLYEYQCTACNERSEVLQKFSDPPHSHCSKCGGEMKKLHSAPAIQFKGSGFYKTDYASKPAAAATKPESKGDASSPSSTAETKSETKTESKSDSKAETKSD
jgi:putative FmdB family regulatory protein